MTNPDMRTIVFSFLIADVTITMFMVLFAAQGSGRFRGIYFWVAAFLLQNIGIILIQLRGAVPDWSSIVLSNTMIIAGMLAGFKGMCRFLEVKYNQFHNYLLILGFGVIEIWFGLVSPDLSVRTINTAAAMVILSVQFIWLIFFRVRGGREKVSSVVGMIFIGYVVVNLARIADFFIGGYNSNDYFSSGTFEMAVFIAYQVLFIFLAYSLALMYNRWLLYNIATQEEKFSKAFNSSPYAILITRYTDGSILEVNEGFTRITGFSYKEVIGKTTNQLQLWIMESDRMEFINEISEGRLYEKQKRFRVKSGLIITGLISAEMIRVNDEEFIIASINDITNLEHNKVLLQEKVADLERYNKLMTGRELRMIELKNEVNELCENLGLEKRYLK